MLIPVEWIVRVLAPITVLGAALGTLSLFSPARSIGLYQAMMRMFNWRVEPINYQRELRTTRIFGAVIIALSAAIVIALIRSEALPLLW